MCGQEKQINTIDDSRKIASNINSTVSLARTSADVECESFAVLNVPFVTDKTYQSYSQDISSFIEYTASNIMEDAGL